MASASDSITVVNPLSWVTSLRPVAGRTMSVAPPSTDEWRRSPAEFDFRSDTLTTPTPAMLAALPTASLGDDVYEESTTTNALSARLAAMFGKPEALFVPSGTMGNQLCLRALLVQPPYSVICDHRAHIYTDEAGATSLISQAHLIPVIPKNGLYMTLEDIKANIVISDDIHFSPTRVISLENTISSVIHPLAEIKRICEFARQNGIKVHLDGARLWNACSVPGAPSLAEYAAEVDSLMVCVSKSLGAPFGSFVIGSRELVAKANHIRKLLGGGMRQVGILTAMADIAVTETFLGGRLAEANAYAKMIEAAWLRCGGKMLLPVDTNAAWIDLESRGVSEDIWQQVAAEKGVRIGGVRVMCHYQNSKAAIERLEAVMQEACKRADATGKKTKAPVGEFEVVKKSYLSKM